MLARLRIFVCVVALITCRLGHRAAVAVDFSADVLPILENYCLHCHDRDTLEGGVGLDSFYHAGLTTNAGEPLIVAGRPDKSALYRVLIHSDPQHRMPQDDDPLPDDKIQTIRQWIEEGGVWPDDGWRPPRHWSFETPTRPEIPRIGREMLNGRQPNEIDTFVAAKLHENGLAMNPVAQPARLLRRVYLDITGLPPSVQQVDAFIANPSFDHYVRIVDRLLSSVAYGEKWAIQWLDLARYADSEGYQRDSPRTMWPYRDWVIKSLNHDMPFDQFTIEQLAGDLLENASPDQVLATAFHRNATMNLEAGTDPKEDRYKMIVDRVNTTGSIWLGLTVGCAQCHNHKYDPLTAKEYYQLFAFFNRVPMESRQIGDKMGMSGLEAIGPTLAMEATTVDRQTLDTENRRLAAQLGELEATIRKAAVKIIQKRKTGREGVTPAVLDALDSDQPLTLAQCKTITNKLLRNKAPGLKADLDRAQVRQNRIDALKEKKVRVMKDGSDARPTFIAKRGDFLSPGERVDPATPASLHPYDPAWPRNRLGLARWIVDPQNPLVARASINRLWIEIFGQGLVTTPGDFGVQGELPTHPELLDWLSVAFIQEDGWSMKRALRRVVLSATYRQSVLVDPEHFAIDPSNQWLWRHPGHRFKAEVIRDQALSVSGLLTQKLGGFHVRPFQPTTFWGRTAGAGEEHYLPSSGEDAYRRGVYTQWRRNAHYPSFANFDAPDRAACTIQRDVSNTPLQALTLLNDPVYVEISNAFGKRIRNEGGPTLRDRIVWAFRTVLARHPNANEIQVLERTFGRVCESGGSLDDGYKEIAIVLLNLHETINRS